jgi:hypothetical protein
MPFFDPHEYAPEYAAKVLGNTGVNAYGQPLTPDQVKMLQYQPAYHFASDEQGQWYWYDKTDPEGNVASPDDRHYFGPDAISGWSPQMQQDYAFSRGLTQESAPGGPLYSGTEPTFWDSFLASIPMMVAGGIMGAGAAGGLAAEAAAAGGGAAAGGLGAALSANNPSLWWSALQAIQHLTADPSGQTIGGVLGSAAGSLGGAALGTDLGIQGGGPIGGAVGGFGGSQAGGALDASTPEGRSESLGTLPQAEYGKLAEALRSVLGEDRAQALLQNPQSQQTLLLLLALLGRQGTNGR